MEALLNFAWLVASLALLGFGMQHYRARSNRRHATWLVVVAIAVVAVVLFPVISCTDDLNPTIFASEDLSRRHTWSSVAHLPSHPPLLPMDAFVALLFAIGLVVAGEAESERDARFASFGFARLVAGRGPPFLA